MSGGLSFVSIQAGSDHTCGLTTDHIVYCWGSNQRGQLTDAVTGSSSDVPVKILGQP